MITLRDVFGGRSPVAVHNRLVSKMFSMGRRFDEVVKAGVVFRGKTSYDGQPDADIVGDADDALQADFLQGFESDELFEGWGVIGEEDNLQIPPTLVTNDGPVVVTIDPVDGTERLRWVLSDPTNARSGVTSMVAVKIGGQVVAVYILDLFTKELFFVRADMPGKVFYQANIVVSPISTTGKVTMLEQGTLLLHNEPRFHQSLLDWMAARPQPIFATNHVSQESIGGSLLQVVRGKVVAMSRRPHGFFTPWDDSPLVGLCRAARIRTFWIEPNGVFEEFVMQAPDDKMRRERGVLYLPTHFVEQLARVADVRQLA